MSVRQVLLETLKGLGDEQFKTFRWFLQEPVLPGFPVLPKSQLEKADMLDTVDKIIETYNQHATEVVKKTLMKIQRNDLVDKLPSSTTAAQGTYQDKLNQNGCSASEEAPLRPSLVKASEDALINNTSSVHTDIILNSRLIRSGPPAVYQLRTKTENIGTLRRITLGERNKNKENKTILLVGPRGGGKSTLINTLVNYTMGVKWEDDVWFQIVEEEERGQSESQTSDVMVYQIFGFEGKTLPYSLTIIDTPGYGDTRGIEKDEIIRERLLDLFRSDDGVHEINAVGLVLEATENRLSDRLRYVIDSVMSLFGKDMEKNIVPLITHSDGLTPENVLQALKDAKIKCAKDEENEPLHFLFNNLQSTQKTKKNNRPLKNAWDLSTYGMSEFTDFLHKTEPQNLKTTMDVQIVRIRLKVSIQRLRAVLDFFDLTRRERKQTQADLFRYEQEKLLYPQNTSRLLDLENEMKNLQREKDQWLDESFHHIIRLEQIALNVDSLSTYVHLDFLTERMKEKGDTEKVQKLEEMRKRVDEGDRAELWYKHKRRRTT